MHSRRLEQTISWREVCRPETSSVHKITSLSTDPSAIHVKFKPAPSEGHHYALYKNSINEVSSIDSDADAAAGAAEFVRRSGSRIMSRQTSDSHKRSMSLSPGAVYLAATLTAQQRPKSRVRESRILRIRVGLKTVTATSATVAHTLTTTRRSWRSKNLDLTKSANQPTCWMR